MTPLRASVSLGLSQQSILVTDYKDSGRIPGTGKPAGTQPLAAAKAGDNVQSIAAASGMGSDWQRIAAANGIENPRSLGAGVLLDLHPPRIG